MHYVIMRSWNVLRRNLLVQDPEKNVCQSPQLSGAYALCPSLRGKIRSLHRMCSFSRPWALGKSGLPEKRLRGIKVLDGFNLYDWRLD